MKEKPRVLFLDTRPIRRGAQVFIHDLKHRFSIEGIPVMRIFLYQENQYDQLSLEDDDLVMPYRENHLFEKIPTVHPSLVIRLAKEIKYFNPDIILCNGSRTLKYAAIVKKFYYSIKSKWVYRVIDSAIYWNKNFITLFYYQYFVIPSMDAAVGVSQKSLDEMILHYGFNRPSISIPRAIDLDHFTKYVPNIYARENAGILKESFILLFLANFTSQKRPDRFLTIIHALLKDIPNVHGLMVGDGPLKAEIEQQAIQLGIQGRITCVGYQRDVRPWIAMSDVLLLTSDTEGMPGVVLEAGAMKKSTVSNDVGGIKEVISDQKSGFIVTNGDINQFTHKILELHRSADLRIKHENAIFESIHYRNSLDTISTNYKLFFEKIKLGI